MKTLPFPVLQSLCKIAFLQISACLCRALASKPLEIQTWDQSRLKDFLKIFQNVLIEKSQNCFLYLFYEQISRCVFFFESSCKFEPFFKFHPIVNTAQQKTLKIGENTSTSTRNGGYKDPWLASFFVFLYFVSCILYLAS